MVPNPAEKQMLCFASISETFEENYFKYIFNHIWHIINIEKSYLLNIVCYSWFELATAEIFLQTREFLKYFVEKILVKYDFGLSYYYKPYHLIYTSLIRTYTHHKCM